MDNRKKSEVDDDSDSYDDGQEKHGERVLSSSLIAHLAQKKEDDESNYVCNDNKNDDNFEGISSNNEANYEKERTKEESPVNKDLTALSNITTDITNREKISRASTEDASFLVVPCTTETTTTKETTVKGVRNAIRSNDEDNEKINNDKFDENTIINEVSLVSNTSIHSVMKSPLNNQLTISRAEANATRTEEKQNKSEIMKHYNQLLDHIEANATELDMMTKTTTTARMSLLSQNKSLVPNEQYRTANINNGDGDNTNLIIPPTSPNASALGSNNNLNEIVSMTSTTVKAIPVSSLVVTATPIRPVVRRNDVPFDLIRVERNGMQDDNTNKNKRATNWFIRHRYYETCTVIILLIVIGSSVGIACSGGNCVATKSSNDKEASNDMKTRNDTSINATDHLGRPMKYGRPFIENQELYDTVDTYLAGQNVTNLYNTYGSFEVWDVSRITVMTELFSVERTPYTYNFNLDISRWNVCSVVDMSSMFLGSRAFSLDLFNWDTSSVTRMDHMFERATNFNGDVSNWDVSKVQRMDYMFAKATSYSEFYLSKWDTSKVRHFDYMFQSIAGFLGFGIDEWDVSNAISMSSMFEQAAAFDANISNWDVSKVTTMEGMFTMAASYTGAGIGEWNVSSVETMANMFRGAKQFNANVSKWDVSKAQNMTMMFYQAQSFQGIGLNNWIFDNSCDISQMFCQTLIVPGSNAIKQWTTDSQNISTSCDITL